jgi:hypothetical protein
MQAITTKYLGPTDHNGARIVARCQARRKVAGFSYGAHEPHDVAAAHLLHALGWGGAWVGGGLPDGTGNAYVCARWADSSKADCVTTVNGVPISDLMKQG